jgi:hypothetical protein
LTLAECVPLRWRDAASRLQLHERTTVVGSEHRAVVPDGERSQTDNVLVVCEGPRQVADKKMHRTDIHPVRKACAGG